jgi:hypothetical protein
MSQSEAPRGALYAEQVALTHGPVGGRLIFSDLMLVPTGAASPTMDEGISSVAVTRVAVQQAQIVMPIPSLVELRNLLLQAFPLEKAN